MASAAPNTAVPLPTATATSATTGVAAPPVSTMHAAPVAISTAPPTVLQIPCVFTYNRNVSLTFYLFHQKNENCYLYNYSSNFPHFIGFPACPLVK